MLHGCGACDVKGFLACMISAASALDTAQLNKQLCMVFTSDEEVGCRGARFLSEQAALRPRYAIVGEPTSLVPARAGKGYCLASISVYGKSAHSAYPSSGRSAIFVAAKLVTAIEILGEELSSHRNEAFDPSVHHRQHWPDPRWHREKRSPRRVFIPGGVAAHSRSITRLRSRTSQATRDRPHQRRHHNRGRHSPHGCGLRNPAGSPVLAARRLDRASTQRRLRHRSSLADAHGRRSRGHRSRIDAHRTQPARVCPHQRARRLRASPAHSHRASLHLIALKVYSALQSPQNHPQ